MNLGKIVLIVFWLVLLSGFIIDSPIAPFGRWAATVMFLVHLVEALAYRGALAKAPGSMGHNIVQTVIFGFLHIREVHGAGEGQA